jgi:LysM repeat protein
MSPETTSQRTKVCPTCGTRLSENTMRCPVCGTDLGPRSEPRAAKKVERSVQASRMPDVTVSLPAALGILAIVLMVGAAVVFFGLRAGGRVVNPAPIASPTETATASPTPTETLIPSLTPTVTPIPPFDYPVKAGETCSDLVYLFHVSLQSIIILNNLDTQCTIGANQVIKIPYPTATQPPAPTSTPLAAEATVQACDKVIITVQAGDTLDIIARNYAVSMQAIKDFNGLTTDAVYTGTQLMIPLCMRAATPGPTPTATIPPPYPAPNLLLPADGAAFTLANDVATLQWASIGTLHDNEAYQVTVEDVTASQTRRLTDYVTDTKYIVPTSFRPKDNVAHILRWWITPVRQAGSDEQGSPIWVTAGATSEKRVFSWTGTAVEGTPVP